MNKHIYYDKGNNTCYVSLNNYVNELYEGIMPDKTIRDIQNSIEKELEYKQLQLNLLSKCNDICEYNNNSNCSMPIGSINSDIMIINTKPDEFELGTTCSMTKPNNFLLPYLIKFMKIDYYCTDIVKCNNCKDVRQCASNYLLQEINIVNPKLIIFNGMDSFNMAKNVILNNKFFSKDGIYYGNIYSIDNINFIIVYDTQKIFDENNSSIQVRQKELWNQLLIVKKFLEDKK